LDHYNQLLKSEDTKKRRAEHFGWAFDRFEAGSLKKQKMTVAEDNKRDLLETDEEIVIYDMNKRLRDTPLFMRDIKRSN
jgi:L-arabinose isomerase